RHTISKRDWSSDVCSSDLDGFWEDRNTRREGEKHIQIQLVEIGRGKVSRVIEVPDGSTPDQIAQEIAEEASQHLRSTEISATWDGEQGTVFAGFHSVGKAKLLKA